MRRWHRWLAAVTGLGLLAFPAGFVLFAASATREPGPLPAEADAIVVLTGGEDRIRVGARLLSRGLGTRLLISGVNSQTRPRDIRALDRLRPELKACCVDFGYAARNTSGNAEETAAWASRHGFRKLIVVTSSYHMPRSLIEMAREDDRLDLIAYPVVPKSFREQAWWLNGYSVRVIAAEYLKLWPAAARLVLHRLAAAARPEPSAPGTVMHGDAAQR
ncbi:MAG: YdcF family protein [Hyphomicrobiaceae bacterium]|nr:YdcF family protein [Hyphomicrobiaceae bacterium]